LPALRRLTGALHVATGQPRPESHPTTQRIFENLWCERILDLAPWSLAAAHGGYRNGPRGRAIDETVHSWSRCPDDSAWDLAAKALRTTRDDELPHALRRRREQKRKTTLAQWRTEEAARLSSGRRPRKEPMIALPHLTAAERLDAAARLRPYMLMDYLWRLRVKTNYEDATMFTDGPQDEISSGAVHRDLVSIADATMVVFELHLRQMLGAPTLRRLMDDWITRNDPNPGPSFGRSGVAARRPFIFPM
jgi:hypothetical protein